jgi:hypothetical protein
MREERTSRVEVRISTVLALLLLAAVSVLAKVTRL